MANKHSIVVQLHNWSFSPEMEDVINGLSASAQDELVRFIECMADGVEPEGEKEEDPEFWGGVL